MTTLSRPQTQSLPVAGSLSRTRATRRTARPARRRWPPRRPAARARPAVCPRDRRSVGEEARRVLAVEVDVAEHGAGVVDVGGVGARDVGGGARPRGQRLAPVHAGGVDQELKWEGSGQK
jgi:hypothetical protein